MKRSMNQHNIDGQYVMTLVIQRARSWRADVWAVKSFVGDIGGGDMLHIGIIDVTDDETSTFHQCNELVIKHIDKIPAFTIE